MTLGILSVEIAGTLGILPVKLIILLVEVSLVTIPLGLVAVSGAREAEIGAVEGGLGLEGAHHVHAHVHSHGRGGHHVVGMTHRGLSPVAGRSRWSCRGT